MVDIDIRRINGAENQEFDAERGIYPGQVEAPLIHIFPLEFEDGFNEPRGGGITLDPTLPNARDVSNIIADQGDALGNPANASDWLWQWGQFLDHDLSLAEGTNILAEQDEDEFTANDISITLSPDDILYAEPNFTKILLGRVPAEAGTGTDIDNPREIVNEITSFIDGSNGYGSDYSRAAAKRSDLGNSFFGKGFEENEEGELELFDIHEEGGVPLPPDGESPFDGKLLVANDAYGTDGLLFDNGSDPNNTSGEILAPYNRANSPNADPGDRTPNAQEFISGDLRINEQVGLISIHTLFIREHNFVADKVAFHLDANDDPRLTEAYEQFRDEYVPSLNLGFEPTEAQIRGEFIYEASREVVAAKNQVITYEEFLPVLLGNQGPDDLQKIDEDILDPDIAIEFAGAAYRLGHTLLSDQIRTIDNNGTGSYSLREAFFTPQEVSRNGIDDILLGLNYQQANDLDERVIDGVRNNLFGPPGSGGQDLVAINLQRGRELGVASYTTIYNSLNPDNPIESFEDLNPIFGEEVAAKFVEAYDTVDQIDLWLAGLAEIPQNGALLGPTFSAILGDQFARLRDGDRFFYTDLLENEDSLLNVVSNAIGTDFNEVTLSSVIANHVSNPELVPDDAFTVPFTNEVRGTLDSDTGSRGVFGTEAADLIDASTGNDLVQAGDGDDIVFGGTGNDTLEGQGGADSLVGGNGSDLLIAEGAGDVLSGGLNNDTYQIVLDQVDGGVEIVEEAGPNDVLEIFAGGGGTPVNATLLNPSPGRVGIKKSGRDLVLDLNQDGILNPEDDLTITNYFSEEGGFSGGSIEDVAGLSREEIIEYTQSDKVTNGPVVYRFFRPDIGVHFYTPDENERDFIIDNVDGFDFEGASYAGVSEEEDLLTGARPVYRFFNVNTGVHLYTIDENERDFIRGNLDDFNFEGITYYAYETQQEGTTPLYRFFNPVIGAHFYTPSAAERDAVDANLPDYNLEGIDETGTVYYIQEPPTDIA